VAGDVGEAGDAGWKRWRYSEQDIGSAVVIRACVQVCASGRLKILAADKYIQKVPVELRSIHCMCDAT